MLAALWLIIVLAGVAAWTVNDTKQYRHFRIQRESRARRAFYWRWTAQSFVFLTGASAITLWLLGRFDALGTMPSEFATLTSGLRPESESTAASADMRTGMAIGVAISALILVLTLRQRVARLSAPVISDIEPMIPRNGAEMLAALPLCLNAGFAEELFFRLALPLLVTTVTGSVALGIGGSILVFGLIHWYQGWKGVIATAFVGGILTVVYLNSGSILRVMGMHAFIDVLAMIIRPIIAARVARPGVTV
jgi:uncharacterized protein